MTKIFNISSDWYVAKEEASFHDYLDDVLKTRELITYIAFHGDKVFFEEALKTLKDLKTKVIKTNQEKNK